MSQHFLLSAAARALSVLEVAGLSDDAAFDLFKRLRWGDREEVGCPHCGYQVSHFGAVPDGAKINCGQCRAVWSAWPTLHAPRLYLECARGPGLRFSFPLTGA